uniref:Uncharacterized protein n=1 Tax=Tetranychus urticae TaxID=32264 RepID=T1K1P9_TETUR
MKSVKEAKDYQFLRLTLDQFVCYCLAAYRKAAINTDHVYAKWKPS